jgi:hypothetical protein
VSAVSDFTLVDPATIDAGLCLCGCGERPQLRTSRFVSGHDGRLFGHALRISRDSHHPQHLLAVEILQYFGWGGQPTTREFALQACRFALSEKFPDAHELKGEPGLFRIGSLLVRVKGTATKDHAWTWDVAKHGYEKRREDFYLLHDLTSEDEHQFYIAPSDYVRGCLEASHYEYSRAEDGRNLESTLRRLQTWPVRMFRNAWHLLQNEI